MVTADAKAGTTSLAGPRETIGSEKTIDVDPDAHLGGLMSRALAGTSAVGFALLDTELRYVTVNETLARLNGRSAAEHVGRAVCEIFPDINLAFLAEIREVAKTGRPRRDVHVMIPCPAEPSIERWWRESFEPVLDSAGAVVAIAAFVVEITGQRDAEEAREATLRRAEVLGHLSHRLAGERTLEGIVEVATESVGQGLRTARAGLMVLEPGTSRVPRPEQTHFVKPILEQPIPLPGLEAMTKNEIGFYPSLDAMEAAFPTFAAQVRLEKAPLGAFAFAPLVIDGEGIGAIALAWREPIEMSVADLRFLRSVADVTAQTIARLRLLESERQAHATLDAVVQQMPVAVSIVYADGRRVRNPAAFELFGAQGLSNEEMTASIIAANPGVAYEDWPQMQSLNEGVVAIDSEIASRRIDGAKIVTSHSSAPVRDASGRIIAAVELIHDITSRRESEEARKAFIGVLSHELRTPVTSIYAGAKILLRQHDRLDPQTRSELLADVGSEAERLQRMIEDLLVLSRVERGVELAATEPVLVQHAITDLVRRRAGGWPGLQVEVRIEGDLPAVRGEPVYVEQVLRNLLGNAAKYAGGVVEVVARDTPEGVEVSVLDRGPGFTAEDQASLFELFFRSKGATRKAPGAGIGLFVVRQLVQAMGGRVWAENRPDGGAAFRFVLPRFEVDAEE